MTTDPDRLVIGRVHVVQVNGIPWIRAAAVVCAAVGALCGAAREVSAQVLTAENSQVGEARLRPFKPLSDIRFDHHQVKGNDQVVPPVKTLKPTTTSRPEPELKPVYWCSSGLFYNRPYFEEYGLERNGVSHGPIAQPIWSTTRFFVTAAALPALPLIWHPRDHIYFHDEREIGGYYGE